jgi:hypothetical protein
MAMFSIVKIIKDQKRKRNTTMNQDNVIELKNPETSLNESVADLLTSIAREGAIKMLAASIEFEVANLSNNIKQP